MALQVPPAATVLGNATYPHRKRHGVLTEVQYAHPDGSNSNDGLTWGTAKKDIMSAYDALPATGGTIYIGNETYWDSANTDRGIRLLNAEDPAYNGGSPGNSWRVRKACSFIGMPADVAGNSHYGGMANVNGSSSTDRLKPSVWLAGGGTPVLFENLNFRFPAVVHRIGIKSDMSDEINTANTTFRNCHWGLNQIAGNGPGMEIGYTFWLWFEHCTLNGNQLGAYTLTAATRSGAVATFTTSITHALEVGDTVYVTGVTPSGYNGLWRVTSVTSTTFVVTLAADPGGSGSAFGTAEPVINYRRAAIAHEAGRWSSNLPSGLIYMNDCNFNGGGFYYKPGDQFSWGNVVIRNATHEGDFVGPEPPTFLLRTSPYGSVYSGNNGHGILVENIELADAAAGATVEHEGSNSNPHIITCINASAVGNVTQFPAVSSRTQIGFAPGMKGTIIGNHDGHRRDFSPVAVRYANLVSHTLSGGSWTTGRLAPDGTTNASSITNVAVEHYRALRDFSLNDWVVAGVWRRARTFTTPQEADKARVNNAHTDYLWDTGVSGFNLDNLNRWDDGGWEWIADGHKIIQVGTPSNELVLTLTAGTGNTVDYFAPVMFVIPATDGLDDDEVREMIRHLSTYPPSGVAGRLSVTQAFNPFTVKRFGSGSETPILTLDDGYGRLLTINGDSDTWRIKGGSANILRFKDTGEIALEGSMFINTSYLETLTSPNSTGFRALDAALVPLAIRGAASQSANLQQWQDSAGTALLDVTASGAIEGLEQADPAAPAANKGRLYFRDNGSGKTQLCVRFNTGAVQVLATEP